MLNANLDLVPDLTQAMCKTCERGRFCDGNNTVASVQCASGTFADEAGLVECKVGSNRYL